MQTEPASIRRHIDCGDLIGGVFRGIGRKGIPLSPPITHLSGKLGLQRNHAAVILVAARLDLLPDYSLYGFGYAAGSGIAIFLFLGVPDDE